jgi:radical SAM protein with 4Fe4S-binding SPASM domain
VTRKCNLRCDYCFVGWARDWTSTMPPAVAQQIIEEGAGLFPVLHFTGGEPFAYSALFALIEAGLRLPYTEILINTNGTLLTPERVARLAAYGPRLHLSVSLDGPVHLHDPVRARGRYREAVQGLDALLAAGVHVTVMTVVTAAVLQVLATFIGDLYRAHPGIVGVTLFPVGVGPEGSQKPGVKLSPLPPSALQELALTVALLYHSGYNVGVAAYPILNPLLTAYGYPQSRLYQCTAGRGRVCVHADLTVSTCHPVKDPVYGTWKPGLLRRLQHFPAHRQMATRNFDGCRTCTLQEACGHCRAFVTATGAPLYGNDTLCHEVLVPLLGPLQRVG